MLPVLEQFTYEKFTGNTLVKKNKLINDLKDTKIRGYGYSRGEYDTDIFATGAAISGAHGKVVATIVIAALDSRVNGVETLQYHGELVQKAAGAISKKLGSR